MVKAQSHKIIGNLISQHLVQLVYFLIELYLIFTNFLLAINHFIDLFFICRQKKKKKKKKKKLPNLFCAD